MARARAGRVWKKPVLTDWRAFPKRESHLHLEGVAPPALVCRHGVRAAEAPDLVRRLAAEAICPEICPGSNIALALYSDLSAHPIDALRRAGCAVTVSTDDPPLFRSMISDEYRGLENAFGSGAPEFAGLNRAALDADFCGSALKTSLAARLARHEHHSEA